MGLINEFTGINNIEIGKIELLKNFSFFEVDSGFADTVFRAFKDKCYKKRNIVLEIATSKGKTEGQGREYKDQRKSKENNFDKNQKKKSYKAIGRTFNKKKKDFRPGRKDRRR